LVTIFFYKEFSERERLVVVKAESMDSVRGWMLVVGGDKGRLTNDNGDEIG